LEAFLYQPFLWASFGGLVSALATIAGSAASYLRTKDGFRLTTHMSLDFALGMMLAAASVSLLLPAGQAAFVQGFHAVALTALSFGGGVFFIYGVGKLLRHVPDSMTERGANPSAWLFVIAMMLHNLPEGLASGAALGGLDRAHGLPILGAIAIQNLPEGLATVAAFAALGFRQRIAFFGGVVSGLVELVGGILGGLLLGTIENILPIMLAFAGGAMLFVSLRETIESWERHATAQTQHKMLRDLALGAAIMAGLTFVL
jgi:zinc transporter, ZIP family